MEHFAAGDCAVDLIDCKNEAIFGGDEGEIAGLVGDAEADGIGHLFFFGFAARGLEFV